MKEEIFGLEKDFANNEYYGTNVWTEEKYRVLSGNTPIILSAPHAVNQLRGDDVRDAEKYTGSIVRYLSGATSSYAIFQLFTHSDPNNDESNLYRNAIINLINSYNIKLLLDIHSSTFKDDTDIDIVTNRRETLCGNDQLIDKIKELGKKYALKTDENNFPNKEKAYEIIGVSSLLCGIPSIRIVINNNSIDIENNEEKFFRIIKFLEEFINDQKTNLM